MNLPVPPPVITATIPLTLNKFRDFIASVGIYGGVEVGLMAAKGLPLEKVQS
jgi:hypothetical protein